MQPVKLIDFLRFNVHFLSEIYKQQPISSPGMHNRMEYRPLEGFVLAITPFNFTAIGGNLPNQRCHVRQCGCMEMRQHTGLFSANVHADFKRSRIAGWCYQFNLC